MGQMINVNIRMDEDLKKQADYLFNELGLNMSTAVNMFVRQAVRTAGIPFEVTIRANDPRTSFYGNRAVTPDAEATYAPASMTGSENVWPGYPETSSEKDCGPAEP